MKKKTLLSFTLAIMATMWTTAMQAQEYYDLTIALVQVTSRNCNDLSFITGVSGTVKYDNATKTLTLKNASIKVDKYKNAISSKIDGLTIKVIGDNYLCSENNSAILYENSITITGGGSLEAECQKNCAIYANKGNLTIDDCNIKVKSPEYGIAGFNGETENLVIKNANVTAEGTGKGSICDFATLTLSGCKIIEPSGAAFDETMHCVALNGEKVTGKVVIVKDATGINTLATATTTTQQSIYTLSGVRLSNDLNNLPKGIYIVNGKKVVKQ